MDKNEIRRANRRALPKFLLALVVAALIGGTAGFLSGKFRSDMLTDRLRTIGAFFGTHIAPWLLLAAAILMPAVCIPICRSAKRLLGAWDGEDEAVSDAVDRKLSAAIWISSAALIVSYFLIAASYSGGFAAFDSRETTAAFSVGVAAFFAVMVEALIIQQKCVDAAKQTNPEKRASIYDMKFQKKWMEDCDEAEKLLIGKCAYKAYSATNTVCAILAIVLALCALVFEIGFLPSLAVCLIWIVNLSVYCREAMRYSKAGNRIS